MTHVSICIITFQRPTSLKCLLEGINQLAFNKMPTPDLEVIVIDNEVNSSIRELCISLSVDFKWKLHYDIEPKRGISHARNKAVSHVIDKAEFTVFIDDDEVPAVSWLDELLFVQEKYFADVVYGPVLPIFPEHIPSWITEGQFFDRPRHLTGTVLQSAATNNVLVRTDLLRKLDVIFDESWSLSGGEDWHLFQRLSRLGCKIVWSDDALVYEWIPYSRTNLKWLLQRSYRNGNTESLCEIALNSSIVTRNMYAWIGIRRLLKGLIFMPFHIFSKPYEAIRNMKYIAHSLGILAGVFGTRYEEYRKVHKI